MLQEEVLRRFNQEYGKLREEASVDESAKCAFQKVLSGMEPTLDWKDDRWFGKLYTGSGWSSVGAITDLLLRGTGYRDATI